MTIPGISSPPPGSQGQARIDSFARHYLEMHPDYENLTQPQSTSIRANFMEMVYQDWDGKILGHLPALAQHNDVSRAAAWMTEQGTYQPQTHIRLYVGLDLESARTAAADAYDKAEHEAVKQHNIKVLIYMTRRELLIENGKLPPGECGFPLVKENYVSWMLSSGQDFTTHITAGSKEELERIPTW
ncbi:hypothetical protein CEP54_013851 [Fusarium duplospermum]|uniref:Uncharacterized protein n=1 Tax=Fusarium duplospermum TaxID=1325734 RepID=A0A428P0C7_9HYPO|nr:hypothetical protein CEP54_013851 [Fusarium duplospermum]